MFDGHNDLVLSLHGAGGVARRSFFERGDTGHLDLPRMREGGFTGGFFAVWIPPDPASGAPPLRPEPESDPSERPLAPPIDAGYALRMAMALLGTLLRVERESDGALRFVHTAGALRESLATDAITGVLHLEGAEPIDRDLNQLQVFHRAGVRSLGIVWSRPNIFAEGVPFRFPATPDTGPGLTDAGRRLVRECNRLGIMLDLSHLNERGFWDVAEISEAPLVATHSNSHALSQTPRNLTDAQLDAIRDSQGMVGINFAVAFTRADGAHTTDTPLAELARHFAYIADRIGVEHVGFGSDFDGTTIPDELGDVTGLPKLLDALREVGFDDADLHRMGTDNWVSLLERTWR